MSSPHQHFQSSQSIAPRQGSVSSLSDHFSSAGPSNHASHVFSPSSATSPDNPAPPKPKPRSCITCRRRKVRCDKNQPCSNCLAHHVPCEMPSAMRQKRKKRSKKPENEELLDRLRRLEGMVEGIGKEKGSNAYESFGNDPAGTDVASDTSASLSRTSTGPKFGRLVIDEGKSRYVNDRFWSALNDEVNGIKTLIDDSTEDEIKSNKTTPDSTPEEHHHEFMFSYSSAVINMKAFHPKPEHVEVLWAAYKTNVEPLIKILHMPTFEPQFREAQEHLDKMSKPMEAMIFAIYFSTVTSMSEEDCLSKLCEERQKLIVKYKFALEQALSRANFLSTQSFTTLSAFVLFLIASRHQTTTRLVWSLTGVAVRLAISLGLHRDGSLFKISPFDTQMRRRLWWHVVILDNRVSEDQGSDPTITEESFDTALPLNVDDSDIWPGMESPPIERVGGTDMTFPIVRAEITRTYRRLTYVPPSSKAGAGGTASLETKVQWIEDTSAMLESRFLKHMDLTKPLNWASATVTRLIMAKLWLIVHHPFQYNAASLPQATRDRLFHVSIDVIEYSTLLHTDQETKKWAWMHRTYVQWHAVAFLLKELCDRPSGPDVDRAWAAVDLMWNEWGPAPEKRSGLWKLLRSLLLKARAARPPGSQSRDPLREQGEGPAAKSRITDTGSTSSPVSFQPPSQGQNPGQTFGSYGSDFMFTSPSTGTDSGGQPSRTGSGNVVQPHQSQSQVAQPQNSRAHFEFGLEAADVPLNLEDLDWAVLDGVDDSGMINAPQPGMGEMSGLGVLGTGGAVDTAGAAAMDQGDVNMSGMGGGLGGAAGGGFPGTPGGGMGHGLSSWGGMGGPRINNWF